MDHSIIYDIETYPNVFTLAYDFADCEFSHVFEISQWKNDGEVMWKWLNGLKEKHYRMVGFNNLGFDYPVVHLIAQNKGRVTASQLYDKAQQIITSQDFNRFEHNVWQKNRFVEQVDLFRIHHFDNIARSTSLKALEFAMRMDNISDLPFPVGTVLNEEQVKVLRKYNLHDVEATKKFYHLSTDMIKFREDMVEKEPSKDWVNFSDVRIGTEMMKLELERAGVQLYNFDPITGKTPRQTKRDCIRLAECIPSIVRFSHPEFKRVCEFLKDQLITETKGVFDKLTANVEGLEYVYGTGGVHASVKNKYFEENDEYSIIDFDVTSLYPSIAISYGYYPEHLSQKFVKIYSGLKQKRLQYKKGTVENAAYKLALNGTYGASNEKFSVFYDPKFTMQITLTGQMLISMLAEWVIGTAQIIQANTDGLTFWVAKNKVEQLDKICKDWQAFSMLELERVEYSKMVIMNVSSYIAVRKDGTAKRKSAYEWEKDWHKDQSALVVPKVVEKVLLDGVPIRQTVENWPDKMDFMLRVKVPRTSKLVINLGSLGDCEIQNTTRYYVANNGNPMFKIMPPLSKKPDQWRRIAVNKGWGVVECNNMKNVSKCDINYDFYVNECEKLILGIE